MNVFTLQDFIRNGYVILKPDFPDELHQIIHRKTQLAVKNGNPGNKIFEQIPELHKIFDHVEIRQTLSQIVGDNYIMHPHRPVMSIRRTVMDKNCIKMERLANSLVGIILGDVIIIYV